MIFVKPSQYRPVLRALLKHRFALKRSDLVVATSFEHLLEESVASAAIGKGAWVSDRKVVDYADYEELMATSPCLPVVDWGSIQVARTFLCYTPQLRRARSVAQSTTEAVSRHGGNPRRRTPGPGFSAEV